MKNLQELEYIACASNPGKQLLKICFWFDFCFTALQHILDHIGHGHLARLFLGKPPRQFTTT